MRLAVGTTLIELLAVLSLVVLMMLAFGVVRETELGSVARHIAQEVRAARAQAIVTSIASTCWTVWPTSGPLDALVPPRGLLFNPEGLPRTCDGGGVGNTTILLEHRGRQAAVIVSSLGRVRWELR